MDVERTTAAERLVLRGALTIYREALEAVISVEYDERKAADAAWRLFLTDQLLAEMHAQ